MTRHPCVMLVLLLSCLLCPLHQASAQGAVGLLDTNGTIFQLDHRTGVMTTRAESILSGYNLGATTRRGDKFYFVSEPEGSDENAIFTVSLKTGAISYVDLDRAEDVRALFFKGTKLFGIFYDGTSGFAGLYRIAPSTGVTTFVLDLATLDIDPIPGAITQIGSWYYMLVRPEIDSSRRQILRFKPRAGSTSLTEVTDGNLSPVRCDKIQPNKAGTKLVCLASDSEETTVNVCRLAFNGTATCLTTLAGILRVGGGHTLLGPYNNKYYAFVYAPGEPDNQRFIQFTANGTLRANTTLDTISIGAHFSSPYIVPQP